jgi:hypothetical protein
MSTDVERNNKIRQRYSRIAGLYDLVEVPMEKAFAGWSFSTMEG